jgi:hypothetical protein
MQLPKPRPRVSILILTELVWIQSTQPLDLSPRDSHYAYNLNFRIFAPRFLERQAKRFDAHFTLKAEERCI